jgi:hypothetical protein
MTAKRAALSGLGGAALIVVNVLVGLADFRALGTGVGLVLAAVLSVLFARWIDGPILYYRTWGRLHSFSLQSVTAVGTPKPSKRNHTVSLAAPQLAKPLRISVRRGTYPPAAYEHLRTWLTSPNVRWSSDAVALFNRAAQPTRRRLRVLALAYALPLLFVGGGIVFLVAGRDSFAIPGAPGYTTFSGPHGYVLPFGRPWGQPCQPIRLVANSDVPGWIYSQIATVVSQAREDGIDVTLETRQFYWTPSSLYYRDGQSAATSVRVAIFADDGAAPTLSNGQPGHIERGWDAKIDSDGHNEDLTSVQGTLWLQELAGQPELVRRSIRQLIAMTQGIAATSHQVSGISDATTTDRFTSADLAAMLRMSGCVTTTSSTPPA